MIVYTYSPEQVSVVDVKSGSPGALSIGKAAGATGFDSIDEGSAVKRSSETLLRNAPQKSIAWPRRHRAISAATRAYGGKCQSPRPSSPRKLFGEKVGSAAGIDGLMPSESLE